MFSTSCLLEKYPIIINIISESITPEFNVIAALKPFEILVSIRTKKTGPNTKLRKNPIEMADKISVVIV